MASDPLGSTAVRGEVLDRSNLLLTYDTCHALGEAFSHVGGSQVGMAHTALFGATHASCWTQKLGAPLESGAQKGR